MAMCMIIPHCGIVVNSFLRNIVVDIYSAFMLLLLHKLLLNILRGDLFG